MVLALGLIGCGAPTSPQIENKEPVEDEFALSQSDKLLEQAYDTHKSGVYIKDGSGKVIALYPDVGNAQRFEVELATGQTILLSHDTSSLGRIKGLEAFETVQFSGRYQWSSEGGIVHTSRLKLNGTVY